MRNPKKYQVVNASNGAGVRLVDETDLEGYAMAALKMVYTGRTKFTLQEAVVVQAMCELHAARCKLTNWQGKFKIKEARS